MSAPIVSVIVPTHDYARFLPDAIGSLQGQTLTGWECIVVDDGSTDDTPAVLARLAAGEPRLHVITQAQSGPGAARNAGLAAATGEFVQFLDADDLLGSGKLARHVAALQADPTADIAYGHAAYFRDGSTELIRIGVRDRRVDAAREAEISVPMLTRLLQTNQVTIEGPLVRRSLLDRVGRFDATLRLVEDWDLWLRCALAGARFLYVDSTEPVAMIRLHRASASSSRIPMLQADLQVRCRIQPQLTQPSDRRLNARILAEHRVELAKRLALSGHPRQAVRPLLSAIAWRPRPRWILWLGALALLPLPGGPRLVTVVRDSLAQRRRRSRSASQGA